MVLCPQLTLVSFCLVVSASFAQADTLRKACLTHPHKNAGRHLCACLQSTANVTLSERDQRRVAGFIKNPDLSQQVQRAKKYRDAEFWKRFKKFGRLAERRCS